MDSTVTYKCLGCGAGLLFDAEKQKFACEFCLSEFTEEELKASERQDDTKDYKSEVDEYICSSCGAEVVADKNTAATFCSRVAFSGKVRPAWAAKPSMAPSVKPVSSLWLDTG